MLFRLPDDRERTLIPEGDSKKCILYVLVVKEWNLQPSPTLRGAPRGSGLGLRCVLCGRWLSQLPCCCCKIAASGPLSPPPPPAAAISFLASPTNQNQPTKSNQSKPTKPPRLTFWGRAWLQSCSASRTAQTSASDHPPACPPPA